jgi:hypothetical protein
MRGAAAALAVAIAVIAGCRGPAPARRLDGGAAATVLEAGDLGGEYVFRLRVAWAEGRSVLVELERSDEGPTGRVASEWRKSSRNPRMELELEPHEALMGRFERTLVAARLERLPEAPEETPGCSMTLVAGERTWALSSSSVELDEAPWADVARLLHPRWFTARHLLRAGREAEARLDARNVYHIYRDGIEVLGDSYGPLNGDVTLRQVDAAAEAYRQELWVDAVVAARNALAARISVMERGVVAPLGVVDEGAEAPAAQPGG